MADKDKQVDFGVGADATGFEKGMADAAKAAATGASQIDGHFKKVQGAFEMVQKQLLLLAGLVAGGSFFKEAISESNKLTGEATKLARMLGITGEEASVLRTALDDIGSNGDEYIDTFTKFARQLSKNEDGLRAVGIQTRDSNGHLRDSNTLFNEALHSVGEYKSGLDQNTYAQTMFGKSIDEVMKLQKLNNQVLEDAKQKNEDLGLTITKDNVAASKAYKAAMNDVGDVLTAVQKTIGDAVMPVFTELGEYFASTGPAVVAVFKGAMLALLGVFEFVKAAVKTVAGVIFELISMFIDNIGSLGEIITKALNNDWSGAVQSAKDIGARSGKAYSAAFSNFIDVGNDADANMRKNYDRLYGDGGGAAAGPKGGGKTMGEFKDKAQNGSWEAELADKKLKFQEEQNLAGTFYQFSKQQEVDFWRQKLLLTKAGGADRLAVRKHITELELALGQEAYQHEMATLQTREAAYKNNMDAKLSILDQELVLVKQRFGTESKEYEEVQKKIVEAKRQASEQLKQIDLMRAQSARDAALAELDGQQQIADLERDLGTITQQEMLAKQQAFEIQKNAIAMQALQERETIALKDPDKNIVELERIHQEIQAAERQHQQRLGEIRIAATKESQQYMMGAVNSMGSGFQNVFAQTLQGTMSIRQAMQGMWQAVTQAVSQAMAKMAADWLMVQLKNLIFGKAVAESTITTKAAEAGAGGVASMAGAPFPFNLGAPEFGAAMAATAMAFAPMASASGGFDIPGTLNPITQLHAKEMVLPAKHADVIRNMADEGQGGGGSGGAVHLHVNAVDAQGVARLFKDNGEHIVSALQKQRRNLAF